MVQSCCRSSGEFGSVVVPERECVGSGVAVGPCGEAVAFGAENGGDLVVGGEESLGMTR